MGNTTVRVTSASCWLFCNGSDQFFKVASQYFVLRLYMRIPHEWHVKLEKTVAFLISIMARTSVLIITASSVVHILMLLFMFQHAWPYYTIIPMFRLGDILVSSSLQKTAGDFSDPHGHALTTQVRAIENVKTAAVFQLSASIHEESNKTVTSTWNLDTYYIS